MPHVRFVRLPRTTRVCVPCVVGDMRFLRNQFFSQSSD